MGDVADDGLLAAFAVGDPEAGALFIRRYQRRVFGLARSIVDERALAEDLTQEVAAGESGTVDVTLPESGAVVFYCRFHRDRGMQGAFFFNEGDTVATGTGGG